MAGNQVFSELAAAVRVAGLMHPAVVRKEDGKWCVRSEKNPDWSGGCYKSKKKAEERLQQVEMFKSMKGKKGKKRGKPRKSSLSPASLLAIALKLVQTR